MKLSIIILNYNTKDYLGNLLQSISKSKDNLKKEIIVIDNASSDGSQEMVRDKFSWATLIKSKTNLGFSKGNNLGLKKAKGEYLLLLNSDTKIFANTLTTMVSYMDKNPRVGLSTCKVILENGQLDPASHRGFPTPWAAFTYFSGLEKIFPKSKLFSQYHQGWKNFKKTHSIDSPVGAFYLLRKKTLDEVGLLDEQFFMYAEDLDLSYRIKQASWKIMYVPTTKIIHFKKKSGRDKKGTIAKTTSKHFFDTMKLFYDKHYQNKYPKAIRLFIFSGIWIISKFKK